MATGEETGNDFAAIDMFIPKNGGPGPHAHPDIQETFYIMDGEIEVTSEAGSFTATAGAFVIIPKGGLVHQFKNLQEKSAVLLCY